MHKYRDDIDPKVVGENAVKTSRIKDQLNIDQSDEEEEDETLAEYFSEEEEIESLNEDNESDREQRRG